MHGWLRSSFRRLTARYIAAAPEGISFRSFLFILFFVLAGRICSFAPAAATRFFLDTVVARAEWGYLPALALFLMAAGAIQSFAGYEVSKRSGIQVQLLLSELRIRIYRHILALPVPYFDDTHSGVLYARLIADTEFLRTFVGYQLYDLCGAALTALLALALLFSISAPMALIALVTMGVLGLIVRRRLSAIGPLWEQQSRQFTALSKEVYEALSGIRIIKAYRAEDQEAENFSGTTRAFAGTANVIVRKQSLLSNNSALATIWLTSVIMMIGGMMIRQGRLSAGDTIMFMFCLAFVTLPVTQFLQMSQSLGEARVRLSNVAALLAEPTEGQSPGRNIEIGRVRSHVRFENVSFHYQSGPDVVSDFSVEMKPGAVTAIVGQSGAGKTTVANLLCAFIAPSRGRILVDGTDITALDLASYRAQLGVVLQETFLFDGTVLDNIRFARPDAPQAAVDAACRIAAVDEFAALLPQGYNTLVGERGVKLSGGQKQRIAIARAVLADPSILIFDEATSSLDSVSESAVQSAMRFLVPGRTTLVIAHRLSTIRAADEILVMKSGKIVERGAHEKLLERRGEYYRLSMAQAYGETPHGPGQEDAPLVCLADH